MTMYHKTFLTSDVKVVKQIVQLVPEMCTCTCMPFSTSGKTICSLLKPDFYIYAKIFETIAAKQSKVHFYSVSETYLWLLFHACQNVSTLQSG